MSRAKKNTEFEQGFSCAIATVIRQHDEPTIAFDALRTCFPTLKSLKESGTDPYDLKVLIPLYKSEQP